MKYFSDAFLTVTKLANRRHRKNKASILVSLLHGRLESNQTDGFVLQPKRLQSIIVPMEKQSDNQSFYYTHRQLGNSYCTGTLISLHLAKEEALNTSMLLS